MATILQSRTVKCRIKHWCEWCGEAIYPGDLANYVSAAQDGHIYDVYYHPECADACKKMDLDEGEASGVFFKRGTTEEK